MKAFYRNDSYWFVVAVIFFLFLCFLQGNASTSQLPAYEPFSTSSSAVMNNETNNIAQNENSQLFPITDYTQRQPFEEAQHMSRPMHAPAEDDPPFPGDPGEMLPVGDGLGCLLIFALGYSIIRYKKIKNDV